MANVVVELSADEAKLLKAFQRISQSQDRMDAGLKKLKGSSQDAGKAHEQAFGTQAVASLKGYVGGMMGVGTAVTAVTNALRLQRQESEAAVAGVNQLTDARRRLLQIATSAGDFQAQVSRADALAMRYGISREEASQLLFSARSEGFEGATDFIGRAAGAGVITTQAGAQAAGQIPGLFPGSNLTPQAAVGATLLAAQASRLSFEQIANALPQAAEGAAMAGASPAETMGALSVMAGRFASGEAGAARLKAFGTFAAVRPDLAGGGMLSALDSMQAMSPEDRQKLLGTSQELNAAYMVMSELEPQIRERVKQIEREIVQQATIPAAISAGLDPSTEAGRLNQARMQLQRSQVQAEVARERAFGEQGFETSIALQQYRGELAQQRPNFIDYAYRYAATGAAAGMGAPGDVVRGAGGLMETFGPSASLEALVRPLTNVVESLHEAVGLWKRTAGTMEDAGQTLRDGAVRQQQAAAQVAE